MTSRADLDAAHTVDGPTVDAPTVDGATVDAPTEELPRVRAEPPGDAPWQRLDARVLAVHPALDLVRLLPVLVVVAVTGGTSDDRWRIGFGVVAAVLVLAGGATRWLTTTYRIGATRVELRTGLLRRHHRSVHRDRIRVADLTSTLLHRVFGLAVIRIGTGSREGGEDSELRLDAVGHREAERLRRLLLRTSRVASAPGPEPVPDEVARLRWSWVRFAPLTFSALAVVGAVWATALRAVEEFGWGIADAGRLRPLGDALLWVVGGALVATAVLGSVVVFAEGWWDYRLTRTPDGGLVVRRGLLTRRSLTLEGRRLRGVELDEPLLLRLGRGARPRALTSGLRTHGEEPVGALAPAAPRAEAHRIAAAALGVPAGESVTVALDRHPRAAGVRRLTRAVGPAVVLGVVLGLAPVGPPTAVSVAVLGVLGVVLGLARWAALGHTLTPTHLVTRHGALVRRTVVLRRDGVIGWQVRQSLLQRRTGLVTLVAVSAAGRGRATVLDVGVGRALELIGATTPHLLGGFTVPGAPRSGALITRSG